MKNFFLIVGILTSFNLYVKADTSPTTIEANNRILEILGELNKEIIEELQKATSLEEAFKQINGQYRERDGIERSPLAKSMEKVHGIPGAEFTCYEDDGAGSKIVADSNINNAIRKIKVTKDSKEEDENKYIIEQLRDSSNDTIQLRYFEVSVDPSTQKELLKETIALVTRGKKALYDGKKRFWILRAPVK